MRRFFTCLFSLLLGVSPLLTTGCASRASKQKQAEAAALAAQAKPRRVGTVSTVRDSLGFVLIDAYETLPPGLSLRTINPSTRAETATLTVSQQQSPPFFLGDISTGQPQPGDWVIRPGQQGATPSSSSDPAVPHHLPSEVVPILPPVPNLPPLESDGVPSSLAPVPNLPPLGSSNDVPPALEPVPNLPPLEGGEDEDETDEA